MSCFIEFTAVTCQHISQRGFETVGITSSRRVRINADHIIMYVAANMDDTPPDTDCVEISLINGDTIMVLGSYDEINSLIVNDPFDAFDPFSGQ